MAGVAKLWEHGDLNLDKPVQFYVPEFPEKTWNGEKVTITTRQLLSHLSGIRHYRKDYMTKQSDSENTDTKSSSPEDARKSVQNSNKSGSKEPTDEMELEEYYITQNYASVFESLKLFKDDPLVHKPESKFLYSTHGWTLISAVLERASKMSFEKFLKEVLEELGMENTYLEEQKPLIYNRGRQRNMIKVHHSWLLRCRLGRILRENNKNILRNERYLHNGAHTKPVANRRTVLKTGILASGVLIGGIFFKLHSATAEGEQDLNKHQKEKSDNEDEKVGQHEKPISLSEAVEQCRDIIQRRKDETGSPGVVIAVSVDGRDVWTEGFGYSDVENRLKCTPNTIFRIASISKSITMAAVAKLWEHGDLDLDKPVQFYVPEFPEKTWNGEKVTITTRQLLSHLGGIRHYSKDYMAKKSNSENTDPKSGTSQESRKKSTKNSNKTASKEPSNEIELDEYYITQNYASVLESLKLFKDDPLVHKPESKFLYTTHGWTLISAVVEKAAKMPFEKFLKEVLEELGMENTYLDEQKPLIYNRGRHYIKNKKGRLENAPYVDLSYKWAGGGLVSNVLDLTKFGNAMLYSYQARGYSASVPSSSSSIPKSSSHTSNKEAHLCSPGYLKPDTMKMMWTPVAVPGPKWEGITDGRYGLGWSVSTSKKEYEFCKEQKFIVSHTGGAIGASSVLLILPKEITVSGNQQSGKVNNGLTDSDNVRPLSNINPPKGVVVAIITNMVSVALNTAAYDITTIFDRVDFTK